MTCGEVREALSAIIDGEDPGLPPELVDQHLAGCVGCAGWRERAERVTRAVRLQPVRVPDLTAGVLARVAADPGVQRAATGEARWRPLRNALRLAVALFAVAQAMLAMAVLLGGPSAHTSREIACFELALAVGFALAAWRPDRARVFVPVAMVLAGGLALTTVVDVAGADAALLHEAAHLAAVVQAGLLWALARSEAPAGPGRLAGAAAIPA